MKRARRHPATSAAAEMLTLPIDLVLLARAIGSVQSAAPIYQTSFGLTQLDLKQFSKLWRSLLKMVVRVIKGGKA